MRNLCSALLVAVLLLLSVTTVLAETIYIGDRLVVTVRETPSDNAEVLTTLQTDEAVELLEEGDTYFKVRTQSGLEGYIKQQYLSRERPKTDIIAELERQIARQKKAVAELQATLEQKDSVIAESRSELEQEVANLKQQLSDSTAELGASREELANLRQEYETLKEASDNVVEIVNEREELQKENERLTDELNTLREDNVYLLTTFYIKWFLAGAGVLFVGWLLGKSARKKRRY